MKRLTGVTALLAVSVTAVGAEVHPLTPDCESALALSAAPDYLRADAGVLVLAKEGRTDFFLFRSVAKAGTYHEQEKIGSTLFL